MPLYTEADLDEMQSLLDCTYEDYREKPWFIRNDKKRSKTQESKYIKDKEEK